MSRAPRLLVALDGSALEGSSVHRLLAAVCDGARVGGGEAVHVRAYTLAIKPCIACGPDATPGYCIFHDDMDRVYALLERAHAVVVGSPIYFDTVSGPLKLLIDRCNCITPLVTLPDGSQDCIPKWARTRRGAFVTACSTDHRYDLAERSVRGFLKWVGAKWEETLAWQHADNDLGTAPADLIARARALGRRLIESAPLEVPAVGTREAR
ncbi:MAG TPA: flavodoxin family protein [Methylomirabilota bacterium]|nr:flavodoxin family protein [Methylomirabilota bacterium]